MDTTVFILAVAIIILFVVIIALIIAMLVLRARKPRTEVNEPQATPAFTPLAPTDRFQRDASQQKAPSQDEATSSGQSSAGSGAVTPAHTRAQPIVAISSMTAANGAREAQIVCLAGLQQGRHATFAANKITIGRDPKNTIVLSDLFVSPHHVEIKIDSGQVILEDLNSAHGTWTDGKRVMQAPLTEHMQFHIGQSMFALVLPGHTAPIPKANDARWFAASHQPVMPFLADYLFENADDGTVAGPLTVFKARAIKTTGQTNGEVWVKYLSKPTFADNAFFRAKFEQQIAIGRTINHPHCARILGGDTRAIPHIIEQRLPGGTLAERLREGEKMSEDEITHVIGHACNALSYLHKRNIVHQAITPANIGFDAEGRVHLLNCGFARLFSEPHPTSLGVFTGDPRYLASEQLRGDAVGQQADFYALGVIAYQMATGHLPFESDDEAELVRQHLEARLVMPRKLNGALSDHMSLAIMKALDKDPLHRFANAREMAKSFGYTEQFIASKDATGLMFMPRNQSMYPQQAQDDFNPYDYRPRPPVPAVQGATQLHLKNIASGTVMAINGPRMVITREMINTADNMISRTNGQIYQQNGAWYIAELPEAMSANGLFVNNIRVAQPRSIKVGDQIRFGKTTLKVIN